MKHSIVIYFLFFLFMLSCQNDTEHSGKEEQNNKREIKGSKAVYGKRLTLAVSKKKTTFFPLDIIDASSSKIVSQIHDGLVRFDAEDLSVLPAIAKDWETNEEQTEYTFFLRNDVYFHDDSCFTNAKGRKVAASDFKYSFELLSRKDFSHGFNTLFKDRLQGANDFYEGKTNSISGIKVINDSTLVLKLTKPSNSFIYGLADVPASVIAKEAYEKYGKDSKVGTGPFVFHSLNDKGDILLTYNPNYYLKDQEGNRLPYLDTIEFKYVSSKMKELKAFERGELSLIHGLPASKIASVISDNIVNFNKIPPKTILDRKPEMGVDYYEFNLTRPPFNNKLVRQAFAYAIDKNKISTTIIKGQGTVAKHGITPKIPTFNGYDFDVLEGYTFNPEKAKKLLAQAGYPNGKNFPYTRLEVNRDNGLHRAVANEIISQLKQVLNVNIELDQVPFKEKLEHSKYAKAEMFRSGWVADFPSPESFLSICYGANVPKSLDEPSYPNTTRYQNPVYDSLFRMGQTAKTKKESYNYLVQAEKILLEDVPVLPLWYNEDYYLRQAYVRNFNYNPMEYYDLSIVYIKPLTKEEVLEQQKKDNFQEGL